ncbi:hypothetical protein LZ554_008663 [Drepanopeziza brunnea f. sp. 'monogermtubi']|nr:hypothetical protein LZ554_008663 [Drepanopeziza brunnea f. sp. 'monogermtubi']
MFRSLRAAENAAIEGATTEWDTQTCELMKDDLLPVRSAAPAGSLSLAFPRPGPALTLKKSSPIPHNAEVTEVASTNAILNLGPGFASAPQIAYLEHVQEKPEVEGESRGIEIRHVQGNGNDNDNLDIGQSEELDAPSRRPSANAILPPPPPPPQPRPKDRVRRDSKLVSPSLLPEGQLAGLNQEKLRPNQAKMDDSTQKSSMSLTQENPDWVNDHYRVQENLLEECPSTATPDEDPPAPAPGPYDIAKHTTRTQSTAYTYEENDTGHITLNFNPESEVADEGADEDEEEPSQDASYAVALPIQYSSHSLEPKTPAPPVNPFLQKGSVMKGSELFGATQPSSFGRNMASPSSSRPSPTVYNGFSSPAKRQTFVPSSPSRRRPDPELPDLESEANDATSLQSSVRNMLSRSLSASNHTRTTQSFDAGLRRQPQNPEPRAYISMKESQEKRQRRQPKIIVSESEDDSDEEIQNRVLQKKRDLKVQKELATVGVSRKRMPSSLPRSSVPQSSSTPAIEVPSTGRRRSVQEEYLAQCSGHDARDTQQDDIIVDSQANNNLASSPTRQSTPKPMELPKLPRPEEELVTTAADVDEEETEDEDENRDGNADGITNSSTRPPENKLLPDMSSNSVSEPSAPEPSLPSQGLPSNQINLQTPTRGYSDTVPETSPVEERLRPMGEIANVSFDRQDSAMDNLPGFTPDADFDAAMKVRTSPKPPPSRSSGLRRQASANVSKNLRSPVTDGALSNVSSSALSSLPSSPADPTIHGETTMLGGLAGQDQPGTSETGQKGHRDTELPTENQSTTAGRELTNMEQALKTVREGLVEDDPKRSQQPKVAVDQEEAAAGLPVQDQIVGEEVEPVKAFSAVAPEAPLPENSIADTSVADSGAPLQTISPAPKKGLKTYSKAKATRGSKRSDIAVAAAPSTATHRASSRVTKATPKAQLAGATATPISTPRVTPRTTPSTEAAMTSAGSSTRNSAASSNAKPPVTSAIAIGPSVVPPPPKRTAKRKSSATVVEEPVLPTRSSKRQSTANLKECSPDPLALPSPLTAARRTAPGLFNNMTFAVSYVGHEREKNEATKLIFDNGGRILPDGFDSLFETPKSGASNDTDMILSQSAKSTGFVALIADEHSRKAKYMQALALGLPCISGHWITACVSKLSIVDWSPYLLCAGQSSILGNAHKSRVLQPYPAADASLKDVFSKRGKLLEGKSVLLVTGRGKQEKRKAYSFLARALGPARIGQAADYQEARKRLSEGQEGKEREWDMLYVDTHEQAAEAAVFGTSTVSSSASKKRKRGPTQAVDDSPAPKKIRIISDETMIQSLILGQLLDD